MTRAAERRAYRRQRSDARNAVRDMERIADAEAIEEHEYDDLSYKHEIKRNVRRDWRHLYGVVA